MTHNAAAQAAALAVVLAGAAWSTLVLANPTERCTQVRVEVDAAGHKVLVGLQNACETRVGCTVSWNLRCGRRRSEARSERVWVEGRAEHQVEASASTCGDEDWAISPPRWRCDETHVTSSVPARRRPR